MRERIAAERVQRHHVGLPIEARASALIRTLIANGTTRVRSHVDIDNDVGLGNLEAVLRVREAYREWIDIDLVAFPQSGVMTEKGAPELMAAALRAGADLVGGLDPAGFDGDVKGQLDIVFGLAERFGKGIDIHLHDGGETGAAELRDIAERTIAAGMQGRVAVSHAFALGTIAPAAFRRDRRPARPRGGCDHDLMPAIRARPAGAGVARAGRDGVRRLGQHSRLLVALSAMATCSIAPRSSPSATECSPTASSKRCSRSRRAKRTRRSARPCRELRAGAVGRPCRGRSGERRGCGRRSAAAKPCHPSGTHRRRARRCVRGARLGSRPWRAAGRRDGDRSATEGARTGAPGAARGAWGELTASSRHSVALRHNRSGIPLGARFAKERDRLFDRVPESGVGAAGKSRGHRPLKARRGIVVVCSEKCPAPASQQFRASVRLDLERIRSAVFCIAPVFRNTPQYVCPPLGEALGCELILKLETANPIRCFKGRGTETVMARLTGSDPKAAVCASAGNLGQALAYSGRNRRISTTVVAGSTANPYKVERIRALGATVRIVDGDIEDARRLARQIANSEGAFLVEDSENIDTCEGAGTIGLELLEGAGPIDAVLIALGGAPWPRASGMSSSAWLHRPKSWACSRGERQRWLCHGGQGPSWRQSARIRSRTG